MLQCNARLQRKAVEAEAAAKGRSLLLCSTHQHFAALPLTSEATAVLMGGKAEAGGGGGDERLGKGCKREERGERSAGETSQWRSSLRSRRHLHQLLCFSVHATVSTVFLRSKPHEQFFARQRLDKPRTSSSFTHLLVTGDHLTTRSCVRHLFLPLPFFAPHCPCFTPRGRAHSAELPAQRQASAAWRSGRRAAQACGFLALAAAAGGEEVAS